MPGNISTGVVQGSDGAGIVEAVGISITKFKPGDRVVTHLSPFLPDDLAPTMKDISAGLGQFVNGTLRECGNFHESALLLAPRNLNFAEASTLTCSGLTAWNAIFGLKGREVHAGSWVLTQGTGGVSIAALQFAVAVGANVVATTSNAEKARLLESLGATHVVNYREHRQWSAIARSFTPDERGFDVIVDVGGDSTLPESLEAVRTDGIVVLTGLLGGGQQPVAMLSALRYACTVRGILLGSRKQFQDMVKFVEERNLHPVLDFRTWALQDVRRAYDWLDNQKHFSKVVIRMG